MIIAGIVLSLALIVCFVVIVLLKRDIRQLYRTLRTIEKSDTNMRATTETFDKEVSALCGTINDILEKQKKITIASEKSNGELRRAITNISHDLRTPLTSAIGYVQMLKSDKTPDDKKCEYLNIIEYRLKSLSNLMSELFEYTQIIEGKITQNIEKVNICNILADILSSFYDDFTERRFVVEVDMPNTPVYVICDLNSFKRVSQNLIQNVLVHGVEHFRLSVDGGNNVITFQNKVANAESLDIERMFDRFYTADLARSGGNTGLGLAIVKELVQSMGGRIKAFKEDDILKINIGFV